VVGEEFLKMMKVNLWFVEVVEVVEVVKVVEVVEVVVEER
jgi:hypothetical protein